MALQEKRLIHSPKAKGIKKFKSEKCKTFQTISEALSFLQNESTSGKKITLNASIDASLTQLKKTSLSVGLNADDILSSVQILTSGKLTDGIIQKMVSCLVPCETVPFLAVQLAISFMSSNLSSFDIKAKLVEWIVAVYDYIQSKEQLHDYYDVFFHFIQSITLCPHICHLLYLITQKEDVKRLWIRKLKEAEAVLGPQRCIQGILSLYQLFRPDLVNMSSNSSNLKYFKQSKAWLNRLASIQQATTNNSMQISAINVMRKSYIKNPDNENSIMCQVLPNIHFVSTHEDCSDTVPFHQVKNFQEMVNNIHRIQLPNHIASLLQYRAMRMVLLNKNDPDIETRLSSWIETTMLREFVFQKRPDGYALREELLQVLIQFSKDIQEGIPCVENVLAQYLATWDGQEHRSKILMLITFCRFCPFDQMQNNFFEPLRRLFFRCSVYFKCSVIDCLTQLVHNFAMIGLARYAFTKYEHQEFVNNSNNPTPVDICFRSLFKPTVPSQFDELELLTDVLEMIRRLCDAGLKVHNYNELLMHQVLCFYEQAAQLFLAYGIPKIAVMSTNVAYHCLFSRNPFFISRACALLSSNKLALETMENQADIEKVVCAYSKDYISTLFKDSAFQPISGSLIFNTKSGSHYHKMCKSASRDPAMALSVGFHPAFIAHALQFANTDDVSEIKEILQDDEKKKNFITYLAEKKGFEGLHDLFLQT